MNLADGGVIRDGFHAELDELRDLRRNSRGYIARIEARERERTGIQSLKVKFNNVFGYFIEVSKANLHLVPDDYDRKQTLVNAERFITPELKELEAKILDAEEKILAIERELFAELRARTPPPQAARIRQTAAAVAELDVTAALAQVAAENRYTTPALLRHRRAARSPPAATRSSRSFSEREAERFIPNDLYLDPCGRIRRHHHRSQHGRQVHLPAPGRAASRSWRRWAPSFPADEALAAAGRPRLHPHRRRRQPRARPLHLHGGDDRDGGHPEHRHRATASIILDEIGRGTATYDGLALAWAVVEHIHQRIRAKTLFATHYHELTELAEQLAGVRNLHVSVKEAGDQIIFLRKVEPGQADRSYGIEVARLAALPMSVIERAREILALHEKTEHEVTEELAPSPAPRRRRCRSSFSSRSTTRSPTGSGTSNLDDLRPIEALTIAERAAEGARAELAAGPRQRGDCENRP